MLLQTPTAGSIRFGMTLFSIVGFTMVVRDCGAQLLTVLVLVQSVPLLGGLPTMAMSPTRPCYLSIAGTVVGEALGHVHTPAGLHTSTLGPTAAPQSPTVWLIVCKDMYLCCYEEALQESWQWIDCVQAGEDLHQSRRISPTENCSLASGFFACSSRTK